MNKGIASNFNKLSDYIMDVKHGGKKVDFERVVNCIVDDREMAVKEILATQSLNQRTRSDKTYHLIVSFREGEKPTGTQVQDIEETICDAIGLGNHQRIVVGHNDTDYYHMHVAVNKINPVTFNVIEPFYDFYRLSEVCQELEKKHGLKRDNHIDKVKERDPQKAKELESHQGLSSFQSWVKVKVKDKLENLICQKNTQWNDVHRFLAHFNLEFRKHGNGFVLADRSQALFIKASSVSRKFSKRSIEGKLGSITEVPDRIKKIKALRGYEKIPVLKHEDRKGLYQKYRSERDVLVVHKRDEMKQLFDRSKMEYEGIRKEFSDKRVEVRLDSNMKPASRKAAYSVLKMERLVRVEEVREKVKKERGQIHEKFRVKSWREFVMGEVESGNEKALGILRSMKCNRLYDQPGKKIIKGREDNNILFKGLEYQVHKNGDVTYGREGRDVMRDEGRKISVISGEKQGVEMALVFAVQKFGKCLDIEGSDEFKAQVLEIVTEKKMNIEFSDSKLEIQRQIQLSMGRDENEKGMGR
ncbi:MAG: relaxase/mobilization nuclease domain-containing protein [Candidatus Margulisbacteria bacterium]|nr:relaxase/mobilization nuclease domain-containing protein [Candidatus Margulisiibacteriota bacterium]